MKKTYSIKPIVTLALMILLFVNVNAQISVTDTYTGQPYTLNKTGNVVYPSLSAPSVVVDENNGWNSGVINSVGADGSDFYVQSFIADVSVITRIGVVLVEYSPEGHVLMSIVKDNAGVPDYANPLYQGSLIDPSTTAQWYYQTNLNVPVTPGDKYYIMIDGLNNSGATGAAGVGSSDTSPITGELMRYSNNSGSYWNTWWTSMAIYVEGTPEPVPVSIWAIVLAFVVIGVGTYFGLRKRLQRKAV